jgi:replicative DNA helicase
MVQVLHQARNEPPNRSPKVPPHNLEAEESLLGAMLISKEAIAEAWDHVHAEDFYKPSHAMVFEAIARLWSKGEPVDVVTVADELARQGLLEQVGGHVALARMSASTPAISSAKRYARIVAEYATLRRLIEVGYEVAELGYEGVDDAGVAVDRAEELIFELGKRHMADTLSPIAELLQESYDHVQSLHERGEVVTGVPTGYVDLDEQLSGLQPSNLVIVGARPSMGKTSFALGIVAHAAMKARIPVLFFSLEMSHLEITTRLLCAEARVDASRIRTGQLRQGDWAKLGQAFGRLERAPIFIDDNPNLTVMDIRAKARRLRARHGLGLVVVDYLQLMSGSNRSENRQVEVSEISRGLKILARELEVPVVALSQLSRGLEMRSDKRPMLADLRESGSLEQDADVVLFIYRDDVYHPDSKESDTAEIIVAKHRNGPTGSTRLTFLSRYAQFANMARM